MRIGSEVYIDEIIIQVKLPDRRLGISNSLNHYIPNTIFRIQDRIALEPLHSRITDSRLHNSRGLCCDLRESLGSRIATSLDLLASSEHRSYRCVSLISLTLIYPQPSFSFSLSQISNEGSISLTDAADVYIDKTALLSEINKAIRDELIKISYSALLKMIIIKFLHNSKFLIFNCVEKSVSIFLD